MKPHFYNHGTKTEPLTTTSIKVVSNFIHALFNQNSQVNNTNYNKKIIGKQFEV